MKLWFDEDLSPTLVQVAIDYGLVATCNRDRAMLGVQDHELRRVVQEEDHILVTDNGSDFRPMFARDELHPGLILVPGAYGRARQQELLRSVRDWLAAEAESSGESAASLMVNKLVEVDEHGNCSMSDLPPNDS